MIPQTNTLFLPIHMIEEYQDKDKFFCSAVVFSPETENNHFHGCPPYISIDNLEMDGNTFYFEIPAIVAYYAKTHPGYTMAGLNKRREEGKRELANQIKALLNI